MKAIEIKPAERYHNDDDRLGDAVDCTGKDILEAIIYFMHDDVEGNEDWDWDITPIS